MSREVELQSCPLQGRQAALRGHVQLYPQLWPLEVSTDLAPSPDAYPSPRSSLVVKELMTRNWLVLRCLSNFYLVEPERRDRGWVRRSPSLPRVKPQACMVFGKGSSKFYMEPLSYVGRECMRTVCSWLWCTPRTSRPGSCGSPERAAGCLRGGTEPWW